MAAHGKKAAANDTGDGPAFTLTRGELESLVENVLRQVLEEGTGQGPRLLDRNGLAERLACSSGQVDRLRRAGMPTVYVGESPRFRYDECVGWMETQKKEG